MSNFDKLVASWVSSADSRPREEREEILSKINKNLETYRALENPSETYARKKAEQKRIEDERRKAAEEEKRREEEKKRQREEERRKQLEARRASLPPLPPSSAKQQQQQPKASAGSHPKRAGSKPLTLKKGSQSATAEDTEKAKPILSKTERTRIDAKKLAVRDVDFNFEDDVEAALKRLRSGEDGPLLGEEHQLLQQQKGSSTKGKPRSQQITPRERKTATTPSGGGPGSTKAKKSGASEKATGSTSPASMPSPQEPPASPVMPGPPEARAPGADMGRDGNNDAHAAQAPAANNTEAAAPASATRGKPPALAMLEQDNDDVDEFRRNEVHEREAMAVFTFGASSSESDSDIPEFTATASAPAATRGGEDECIPDDVDAMLRSRQKKHPSRMGISDASIDLDEARLANFPPTPKSRDKVTIITKALENHYLFSFLDDGDIAKFASIMDLEEFKAGSVILTKGQGNDTLFLILDGNAEALVVDGATDGAEGETTLLGKGATFGDVGLMYNARSAMTVRAKTDLQCASLERKTYKMVTSRSAAERRERYTQFVSDVPFFSELPKEEIMRVAEALKDATYHEGDKVIERGTSGGWLHFVVEGTLKVWSREGQCIATIEKGGVVGHVEFLFHHVAVADVVAASPVVKTAKLSRHQFDRLASLAHAPMRKEVEEGEDFQHYRDTMKSGDAPAQDTSAAFDAPPSYMQEAIPAEQPEHEGAEGAENAN